MPNTIKLVVGIEDEEGELHVFEVTRNMHEGSKGLSTMVSVVKGSPNMDSFREGMIGLVNTLTFSVENMMAVGFSDSTLAWKEHE